MIIKKSPKFIIITVLSLIVLLMIIISLSFNSNYKKTNDNKIEKFNSVYYTNPVKLNNENINFEYSELEGRIQSKEYKDLESLENEINFKLLRSNYFSNNSFEVVYVKYRGISEIYQIPKLAGKEYKKNLDGINICGFLNYINEPYVKMTIIHNKDTKSVPTEYMGYYEIQEGFALSNGQEIKLIKETTLNAESTKYIIVFKHNEVVYTIEKIPTLEKAKEIADSFFR